MLVPQRESGPCFDLWRVRLEASTGTRRAIAAARTLLAQPGTRMYSGNAAALGVQLTCAGRARAAPRSAASFCALPSSGAGRVARRRRTVTVSENGYVVSTSTVEPSGSSAEAGARIACQPVPG